MDEDKVLNTLLDLAEKGEIHYSTKQIKKITSERREEILRNFEQKELEETNELIANMVIVKFEELLKGSSLIKEDSQLAKKLQDRHMFKKDLKNIISYFTPLLPFIGLFEGVVVTSSEIFDNYSSSSNKDESDTSTTEEGEQQDSTEGS